MNFYDAIETLAESGFIDIFLPFMLIFVIVFAVLQKSHILGTGEEKRKYNIVLALVMGMSVVIPHVLGRYPPESDPVLMINNILPNISLIMLAVIAFIMIVGVFGANIKIGDSASLHTIIIIFAALAVIITFGVAAGWFGQLPWWLQFLEDESTQVTFIVILISALLIALIAGPSNSKNENKDNGPTKTWLVQHGNNDKD